jgi:dihydroflavonol-4-reductase
VRFLLTGATGFIGGHLVPYLAERGHPITALVRSTSVTTTLERAGARLVRGDILDGTGLDQAVQGVDAVIHLAGLTKALQPETLHRANVVGTRHLTQALARLDRPPRLVFSSSLAAAGPSTFARPRSEEDVPAPISHYGRSKLAAEQEVRAVADRVPAVIVRPPIVYGPEDKEFMPTLLPMLRLGLLLKPGFAQKQYSLIHVQDLCAGLLAMAQKGPTLCAEDPAQGVYFLSDGELYTWDAFCAALALASGRKARVIALPQSFSYVAGLGAELGSRLFGLVPALNLDKARELACPAWTCSSARAQEALEYRPAYPLARGLETTVQWLKASGRL